MNAGSHLTAEVIDRFARGDLDDAQLSTVLQHLETCPACARAGRTRAADDLAALREELTAEPPTAARGRFWWTIAAAAAIALVIVTALLLPKERSAERPRALAPPRATETVTAEPAPNDLVTRAIESGRLPFSRDLDALRAPADTVRGGAGSRERVMPAGVVIDETRPTFTWPARDGRSYTVSVFDDDREVLRSPPLNAPRWTPDRDLPRGRTLAWQVEIKGGGVETIPSPPSPPAMFRIVTEADHRDLVQARGRHGDDDLVMAVLYARSGMRAEAMRALQGAAAAGNAAAKRILDYETSATQ